MRITVGILAIAIGVAVTGNAWAEAACEVSFKTNCAKCHGDDGKGGNMAKRDVTGALTGKSDADAIATVKAVMMHGSIKKLGDDDLKSAIAFLKCAGDLKNVFLDSCAKCHGNNAKGGKVCKRDITAAVDGKSADEVLAMVGAVKMHSSIKKLSDEDLKSAIAVVQAGATFSSTCSKCHGADGKGGKMVKKDITALVGNKSCVDVCAAIKGVKMHTWVKKTDDAEMKSLVLYLQGLGK